MLIIGHRGCRGLLPENSIASFLEAIRLGVNAIEFDIVISKDNKFVVSHEPFISKTYCLKPDGSELRLEEDKKFNLYKMSYDQIKKFDSGLKSHSRFPLQKNQKSYKPLLIDVVESC